MTKKKGKKKKNREEDTKEARRLRYFRKRGSGKPKSKYERDNPWEDEEYE